MGTAVTGCFEGLKNEIARNGHDNEDDEENDNHFYRKNSMELPETSENAETKSHYYQNKFINQSVNFKN